MIYYKFLGDNYTDGDFAYKIGENILKEKFDPNVNCAEGGLYFTTLENLWEWYCSAYKYIATLTLYNDSIFYKDNDKFKTNKFNIIEIVTIEDFINKLSYQQIIEAVKQNDLILQFVKEQMPKIYLEVVKHFPKELEIVKKQTAELLIEVKKEKFSHLTDVRVRFAPSPTGNLHIGGARIALLNYLFAKQNSGTFLLRIEDTDIKSSKTEFIQSIYEGLKWLGILTSQDLAQNPPVIQSKNLGRHLEVALNLISNGKAYYCQCSPEELQQERDRCELSKITFRYSGRCSNLGLYPTSTNPMVVRIKTPDISEIIVEDCNKGKVSVKTSELDDFIIVRSDGTPTYLLSVVVDDYDMKITHIIRGEDHFTNTFRQLCLYLACDWKQPQFCHISLVMGEDGQKLSKRHGATNINDFKSMGYLPEAMVNYLLTLGRPREDINHLIHSFDKFLEIFRLEQISKSPSRFDYSILNKINRHYVQQLNTEQLWYLTIQSPRFLEQVNWKEIPEICPEIFRLCIDEVKPRSFTLEEFRDLASIYFMSRPLNSTQRTTLTFLPQIKEIISELNFLEELEPQIVLLYELKKISRKPFLSQLRYCLTGLENTPNLINLMSIIGKEEVLKKTGIDSLNNSNIVIKV